MKKIIASLSLLFVWSFVIASPDFTRIALALIVTFIAIAIISSK